MNASRLRARDLSAPFHGIRSPIPVTGVHGRARAYVERMKQHHVFSHLTAAQLWGMPLSLKMQAVSDIHVTTRAPGRAIRARGVVGHQLSLRESELRSLGVLRVTSPAVTWVQLAAMLNVDDLVAVGDYIATDDSRNGRPALATVDELRAETMRSRGGRGIAKAIVALGLVRPGARSRPETFTRLLAMRAGLPEPELNVPIGVGAYEPDLVWLEYGFAAEYEGDYHRAQTQFRRDIRRNEAIVDDDWMTMRVTADDLFDRPVELAARLGRRLASRGWDGMVDVRNIGRFER